MVIDKKYYIWMFLVYGEKFVGQVTKCLHCDETFNRRNILTDEFINRRKYLTDELFTIFLKISVCF